MTANQPELDARHRCLTRRASFHARVAAYVALGAVAPVLLAGLLWPALSDGDRRTAESLLRSPDAAQRKQGAWLAADLRSGELFDRMAHALADGTEPDVLIRESYVFALGKSGDARYADIVADALKRETNGYLRHTAWLSLARLDADRFRAAAVDVDGDQRWDRIGIALGRVQIGELDAIDELLYWARAGTHDQCVAAARGLNRALRPALDAIGRWPVGVRTVDGEAWPPELVDDIIARRRGLDLERLAAQTQAQVENARRLRRIVQRLLGARERLVRWLF
jgi:hypothetical protein